MPDNAEEGQEGTPQHTHMYFEETDLLGYRKLLYDYAMCEANLNGMTGRGHYSGDKDGSLRTTNQEEMMKIYEQYSPEMAWVRIVEPKCLSTWRQQVHTS